MIISPNTDGRTNFLDFLSIGTFMGYLVDILPTLALVFTVIWSFFRILEMQTTHALFYKVFNRRLDKWLALPNSSKKEETNNNGETNN